MSYHDSLSRTLRQHREMLALLRRLDAGDETAYKEIEPLLKSFDAADRAASKARDEKEARIEKRRTSGRLHSGAFEVIPRSHQGCDWGSPSVVLLKKGTLILMWNYGSKFWASQMEPSVYTPGNLHIIDTGPRADRRDRIRITDNHRDPGGPDCRLSKALILRYAKQIDDHFGAGAAEKVATAGLKKTITL